MTRFDASDTVLMVGLMFAMNVFVIKTGYFVDICCSNFMCLRWLALDVVYRYRTCVPLYGV